MPGDERRAIPHLGAMGATGATGLVRRLWHVTLTVGGEAVELADIKVALERLALEHPFLSDGRYAPDRAEVRYWEEADCLQDAAAMALRLWGEHRVSARLPRWEVRGMQVLEHELFDRRGGAREAQLRMSAVGRVRPF